MIWPGNTLALVVLVPSLISLMLLLPGSGVYGAALLTLDAAIAGLALADIASLLGSGALRAVRQCGGTASIGEPHPVELTLVNEGRRPRQLRVRDGRPRPVRG